MSFFLDFELGSLKPKTKYIRVDLVKFFRERPRVYYNRPFYDDVIKMQVNDEIQFDKYKIRYSEYIANREVKRNNLAKYTMIFLYIFTMLNIDLM